MDYLFINAIVKETYSDLTCGCPFPAAYREALIKYCTTDACLTNPAITNVFSYFTLKEAGQAPVMVMSSVNKHTNCASVGRYTQCIGWAWDGQKICRDVDTLFTAGFYQEDEINAGALRGESFPLPRNRRNGWKDLPITMDAEVKTAILTAVMKRWLRQEAVLRIAVPKTADYNSYVLSAVRRIYTFFPAALRVEAGFCSYLPNVKDAAQGIYIGFIPEGMADSNTLFLDGSSRAAVNTLTRSTNRKSLDMFIRHLAGCAPQQLEKFLAEIYEDVEGAGDAKKLTAITPRDYAYVGDALNLLTLQGEQELLYPKWEEFYANLDKYSPEMQKRVQKKIREELQPDAFCRYFEKKCRGVEIPRGVVAQLKNYKVFCTGNQPLCDGLWNTAVAVLNRNGLSFRQIHDQMHAARRDLTPVVDQGKLENLILRAVSAQLEDLKSRVVMRVADAEEMLRSTDQMKREVFNLPSTAETVALQREIEEFSAQLSQKSSALLYRDYTDQFASIRTMPIRKYEDMEKQIKKCNELLKKLTNAPQTAPMQALRDEVQRFVSAKEAAANTSESQFRSVMDQLSSASSYFAMLDILGEKVKTPLEGMQLEELKAKLNQRRAPKITDYKQAFESHYGKQFSLAAAAKLPDVVCSRIIRDICDYNGYMVFEPGDTLKTLAAKRKPLKPVAKWISEDSAADVLFNGRPVDGEWFKNMLTMSHDAASMGNPGDGKTVLLELLAAGVYSGDDLIPCIKMMSRCGINYSEFFQGVLAGQVQNCTERKYYKAYGAILDFMGNQDSLTALQMLEKASRQVQYPDETAMRAYQRFAAAVEAGKQKKRRRKNKKSSKKGGILIGIFALVLVLAVVGIGLVMFLGRDEPTPPEKEETTKPTVEETQPPEPVLESPYPMFDLLAGNAVAVEMLYGQNAVQDFEIYAAKVRDSLNAAEPELQAQIIAAYEAGKDSSEDWDGYFFWLCWLTADYETEAKLEAMNQDSTKQEAEAILRAVRYGLKETVPSTEQEELPEETTAEATEQTETGFIPKPTEETAETTEETTAPGVENTDTTGETTSETEEIIEETTEEITEPPMISLEELIAVTAEAARVPFETEAEEKEQLARSLLLFGADFTKSFAEHRASIDALLAANANNEKLIMEHFRTLPSHTVIHLAEEDIAVTWNEYVFWECWVLSRRADLRLTANSFDEALHDEVMTVILTVHSLLGENVVPADADLLPSEPENTEVQEGEATEPVEAKPFDEIAETAERVFGYAAKIYQDTLAESVTILANAAN